MPRDIIDDPLPHRYRNAAEGGRRDGESCRGGGGGRWATGAGQETGGLAGGAEQETGAGQEAGG